MHELESSASGIVAQILAQEGSKVAVNAILAIIAAPGEKVERQQEAATTDAQPVIPARKAAPPAPSVSKGTKVSPTAQRLAQSKEVDLAQIKGSGPGGIIVERDVQAFLESQPPAHAPSDRYFASPLARRLAKEHGLDYTQIAGSGPSGRVVRDDVLKAVEASKTTVPIVPTPTAQPEAPRAANVIPLTGMRQIIAERMTLSAQTTATVTLNTEADVTGLVELRGWLNAKLEAKNVRLSYTDLFVKIVAQALCKHPRLNATLVDDSIHLVDDVNIGVAVALEDGLVVPVVRNADQKGLSTISQEIQGFAEKARQNQLTPGALRGGTFTITNLGMYGIDAFTPIINPPECAILGIGRIVKKPIVHNDEVVIRSLMHLSLSFDHRIVDGAPAAQFLQTVTEYMTEPYLLLV